MREALDLLRANGWTEDETVSLIESTPFNTCCVDVVLLAAHMMGAPAVLEII